ncbi:hypothetical protein DVR12_27265 [Chitinophaga silvatica]|uniref:Uncharacterized protein n=1 Tax=Chitinophaga silvatica TaxID=2282649 RepID=A0A3E1Y291_9BACT|nr:hypothetical protein DVR12_27265 [Chitinophaga silvatica]
MDMPENLNTQNSNLFTFYIASYWALPTKKDAMGVNSINLPANNVKIPKQCIFSISIFLPNVNG